MRVGQPSLVPELRFQVPRSPGPRACSPPEVTGEGVGPGWACGAAAAVSKSYRIGMEAVATGAAARKPDEGEVLSTRRRPECVAGLLLGNYSPLTRKEDSL